MFMSDFLRSQKKNKQKGVCNFFPNKEKEAAKAVKGSIKDKNSRRSSFRYTEWVIKLTKGASKPKLAIASYESSQQGWWRDLFNQNWVIIFRILHWLLKINNTMKYEICLLQRYRQRRILGFNHITTRVKAVVSWLCLLVVYLGFFFAFLAWKMAKIWVNITSIFP